MDPLRELGKTVILFGFLLVLVGLVLTLGPKLPTSGLGHLPGDIVVQRKNFTIYFPLVTCLLLSVALTLVLWLISFLGRK